MIALSPGMAAYLADAILMLHVGIVAFVVLGQFAVLLGAWCYWAWVRNVWFRLVHVLLMVFVVVQAWLGALCPLTTWEQHLRSLAGQASYRESFIEHWLSRLIFFEAPWWAFVTTYTGFAALVVATWWWVPPGAFPLHRKG
ncbi:DUF2784 domain-containing protein [Lysobacter sp. CFH 32150]|uniref:DUF2784 domain-containing protein n=1 Tax=Lysobacter sp. CFH 32150 TaxID=2927128 RepID=UPI001FA74960|nr:DUF2784 domain-containing protein [Lysobacter sp. CFH 32150]MCI4568789.1 DUF2784 domain-containing protein [Lysobacter sp. CFH 32150]